LRARWPLTQVAATTSRASGLYDSASVSLDTGRAQDGPLGRGTISGEARQAQATSQSALSEPSGGIYVFDDRARLASVNRLARLRFAAMWSNRLDENGTYQPVVRDSVTRCVRATATNRHDLMCEGTKQGAAEREKYVGDRIAEHGFKSPKQHVAEGAAND
jgi:hypothetical protein